MSARSVAVMLAPQSIWDAFEKSHSALLEAISSALQSPSFLETHHVLNLLPSQRQFSAIYRDKDRVVECRKRISDANKALEKIDAICFAAEGVLEMRIQPVAVLPLELIQYIVNFVIESPNEWKKIFRLSHVSHTWRSAVFAMPKLFISPNWSGSSRDVLEAWITRAGLNPLHVEVLPCVKRDAWDKIYRMSLAVVPYLYRVQSIQIDCEGKGVLEFPPAFTSIFRDYNLPILERVFFSRKYPAKLLIRADRAPRLKDLHSFHALLKLTHYESLQVRSLGMRVHSADDLNHLMDIARLQDSPFHLTMYNHSLETNNVGFPTRHGGSSAWVNVISLSLSLQGQPGRLGDLIRQLEMPRLISLELVSPNKAVFETIVQNLPRITESSIKKLVILLSEHRVQCDFIQHLNLTRKEDRNLAQPKPPQFHSLTQFVLCNWNATLRREKPWNISFKAIKTFVKDRKGVLKHLILPPDLCPKRLDKNERNRELSLQALTLDQESELLSVGDLSRIEYEFRISHHNHRIMYGDPKESDGGFGQHQRT
ncbi:hypothetical protein DL93DRAFT_2169239 [Clavulina sp. PMI_390]|nr:hypothetical protein DL93DRAFT_2169239 [Clavulina sp. PMI_390]